MSAPSGDNAAPEASVAASAGVKRPFDASSAGARHGHDHNSNVHVGGISTGTTSSATGLSNAAPSTKSTVAAATTAASGSATARPTRQDSNSSNVSYDREWRRIKSLTSSELEQSEVAAMYGCRAERLYLGAARKKWSAILSGETIGLFETKEEAIKRAVCAALVMNSTNHVAGGTGSDPLARAKKLGRKTPGSKKSSGSKKRGDSSSNTTPEELRIGDLDGSTPNCMDNKTLVTLRQPSHGIHDLDCIACQEEKATIIFEPCLHCVLCARCNEAGVCKSWCPTCRTTITGRVQPYSARVIRPKVYSVYSFM